MWKTIQIHEGTLKKVPLFGMDIEKWVTNGTKKLQMRPKVDLWHQLGVIFL